MLLKPWPVWLDKKTFELRTPNLCDATTQLLKEAATGTRNTLSDSLNAATALVKHGGYRDLPLVISHMASFAKQSHNNLDDVLGLYQIHHKYDVGFNFARMVCSAS